MRVIPSKSDDNATPNYELEDVPYNLWVDGSFLDKNRNKAGTGAVITRADDADLNPVFSFAFNISSLRIRKSKHTELWAATLAMEQLEGFTINKLTFDSPITGNRIEGIRTGDVNYKRLYAEWRETPDLYLRLKAALQDRDDMGIAHVNRKTELMPVADQFSRISANRRIARIFSTAHDNDVPCAYHILNREGNIRQSFFYDRMSEYDVDDYIKGPFQRGDGTPPEP